MLALLALPSILAAAGVLSWAVDRMGVRLGRWVAAAGAWLTLGGLALGWVAGREIAQDSPLGGLGDGIQATLHLDLLAVALAGLILVPVALILTWQPRSGSQAAVAALAAAASLLALEASGLLLVSFLAGTTVMLCLILDQLGNRRGVPRRLVVSGLGAVLALALAGTLLEARTGTDLLAAIPPEELQVPILVLILVAALALAGVIPGLEWPVVDNPVAAAVMVPLAFNLVFRVFNLTGGAGNHVLATAGVAVMLLAAVRAQQAASRNGFLSDLMIAIAGLALFALGTGRPEGSMASLVALAAFGLATAGGPLADGLRQVPFLAVLALLVGVPPALGFGAWSLGLQAGLDSDDLVEQALSLLALGVWWLLLAAGARASTLQATGRGSLTGGLVVAACALVGGMLLGPLLAGVMEPVVTSLAVFTQSSTSVQAGGTGVARASGAWPVLGTGLPLLVVAAILVPLIRRASIGPEPAQDPEPIFRVDLGGLGSRALNLVRGMRPPPLGLFRPLGSERAMAVGAIGLWILVFACLAVVVMR